MEKEVKKGIVHPLTETINQAVAIFRELGFAVAEGPEIEEEKYNFDALRMPANHPARDMQDTFWIKPLSERKLPRTHVSGIQARYMEKNEPPFRIIYPGKVFRHEATDATHEAQFYQIEGLVVEKGASLVHLKSLLVLFFKKLYGDNATVRFRPSFFPFTEPSIEVDVSCFKCGGKNESCSICKGTGFVELLGAGMVHPHVFKSSGVNPDEWTGYAFGMGLDRLVMLKYGVDDVRALYSGDLRLWQTK